MVLKIAFIIILIILLLVIICISVFLCYVIRHRHDIYIIEQVKDFLENRKD